MKPVEITFPKLNHFWLDSGLLGLNIMLNEVDSSIDKTSNEGGLTLKGTEVEIQEALKKAYDLLIKRYYNTSTKNQKEEMAGFFYDTNDNSIKRFPKKQLAGIPALLYGENQIFQFNKGIKWKNKTQHKLPEEYSNIQSVVDVFLQSTGIKSSTSVLLIDSPYEFRPKLENINLQMKQPKGRCFLCGGEVYGKTREITKGTYPFITSSSGFKTFNSMGSSAENVCWKCDYISKFIPVNSFYLIIKNKKKEDLFAFFPYSVSFEKMLNVYKPLQDAKYEDPNLFKNFQHPLGFENYADGYFQKPFEVAFAFLYTLYRKVLLHQESDEEGSVLDWEEMCDLTISRAPLEFVVLYAESKGQTSMGKMVWPFRDSVYFFRLIENIEKSKINIKEVMRLLIDFSQKNDNRTIVRNRACERILKKQSILDLIESHIFSAEISYITPLFEFVIKYEPIIREEGNAMTIDAQEAAVTLGKRIGMTVAENGKKGDLFALRKARRKTDFLNELNRLQFKCKLVVPPDIYEGKLTDSNFIEFKQFCMIAALNSFYAATQPK